MALLDLTLFKKILGVEDDLNNDDYYDFFLTTAEKFIERELEISLAPSTVKYTVDATKGIDFIVLPTRPVNKIIGIYPFYNTEDFYIDTDLIKIEDSLMGYISYPTYFPETKFVIEYDAGFPTVDDIPVDLKYAIYQIGVKMYSYPKQLSQGVSRIRTPDGLVVYDSKLITEGIESILSKYRRQKLS